MASFKFFATVTVVSLIALSCKETIIEYRDNYSPDKSTQNDQYHGDIVGRVVQKESNATVYISQVNVIDSVRIDPTDGSFAFSGVRLGNYDLTITAENYRIYIRSNVVVPGGGIGYVGEIDLSSVPDLISQYYPEKDAEVIYDNRFASLSISILFTQPMDRQSVEAAFSTNPPTSGIFYWGQYIYSPVQRYYTNGDYLIGVDPGAEITTFSKITSVTYVLSRKDCFVDTTYTFTLTTNAHDTSGNHLRFPLVSSFRTVEAGYTVYGIQSDPVDGDIDVSPMISNGIRVTFPRRMDPTTTEAALTVTPGDSRIVLWPQGNQILIYMGGILRTDTLYGIAIDSTARDLDGIPLGEQFSFSFRTAPIQVSYTYPNNGQLFVPATVTIGMTFNTFILKSSVQAVFSIEPRVTGMFQYGGYYHDQKNTVEFVPSGALQPNTKYTVTIGAGVQDMFGTLMKKPTSFSFVTSPE